ncbi:PLP-dependent cysteine synthase family protein [Candidatus Hodarchaeum mangrovi]
MIVFVYTNIPEIKRHRHAPQLHFIGNTPLIELTYLSIFSELADVRIFAKLEMMNLGGSVKDRPALFMIEAAESTGLLTEGKEIIEPSSGNTGIGLAWIGGLKGYQVCIIMPETASQERIDIIRGLGARDILSPGINGTDGAIQRVKELVQKEPERFVLLDQFNNQANWYAHYEGTGREIWKQTNGTITHLIAGIGSGGTIMGTSRYLREKNPNIKVIGVQPAKDSFIPGLRNTDVALIVPSIYQEKEVDKIFYVTANEAQSMTKRLAREASLLVGPSSGAALVGISKYCLFNEDCIKGNIVTIFPDSGVKYLSQRIIH